MSFIPDNPGTALGVNASVVVLSPICPVWFDPQQATVPSFFKAQAWLLLTAIFLAQDRPETVTGVGELTRELLPSSPAPLYHQHLTLPSEIRAQVDVLPAST